MDKERYQGFEKGERCRAMAGERKRRRPREKAAEGRELGREAREERAEEAQ